MEEMEERERDTRVKKNYPSLGVGGTENGGGRRSEGMGEGGERERARDLFASLGLADRFLFILFIRK